MRSTPNPSKSLNAWCELRSPSQQAGKGQTGAAELIVEPDAEVVQRHPRRQTGSQAFQFMGALPPEAKGVEELVVDALDDLAYSGHPSSQALGPGFAAVALGRVDDAHPVAIEPAPMVFFALKALVGHVGSRGESRSHARQPRVRSMPHGEKGLGHLLVGGRSGAEAKARDDARGINGHEQTETLVPSQAIGPTDVGIPGQPSCTPALGVPDGHRRAVQGLVWASLGLHHVRQMQGYLLDEVKTVAYQPVELRAVGQSGEGLAEAGACIAVEVPLAPEACPSGEDGEGGDLAGAQGCIWSGMLFFLRARLAEVVDHNVECGEEGVHVDHESTVPFPSGNGIGKPTLIRGHLPLKFRPNNSHQAFNPKKIHPTHHSPLDGQELRALRWHVCPTVANPEGE